MGPHNFVPTENGDHREENIDLTDSGDLKRWSLQITEPFHREMAARSLAILIVLFSGITLLFILWYGFRIIVYSLDKPEHSKQLIAEAVVPLLEKAATFFTTVFSPLLAFILGFYFGQRQAQRRAGD